MINKIIILLFLSLILISCAEEGKDVSVSMNIIPVSKALNNFDGMVSFKVTANGKDSEAPACKLYADTKEVGFNLTKSGEYTFKFFGYTNQNCNNSGLKWHGFSVSDVNIDEVVDIKIPVGKLDEFTTSSIKLYQEVAFMDAILRNDKIVISGGISSISKDLKRIGDVKCEIATETTCTPDLIGQNPTWVCNFDTNGLATSCYDVISVEDCNKQINDSKKCNKEEGGCLHVKDHKFTKDNSLCKIPSCPFNNDGYACNLTGRKFIQLIDTNELSSSLLYNDSLDEAQKGENRKILKLSRGRILHKTLLMGDNIFFVAGAEVGFLKNTSPFIETRTITHSDENTEAMALIDIYRNNNIDLIFNNRNHILTDFNIFKYEDKDGDRNKDKFFILNGRKDEYFDSNSFFKDIIECDANSCTSDDDKNTGYSAIGAGISSPTRDNDALSYILSGIRAEPAQYANSISYDKHQNEGDELIFGDVTSTDLEKLYFYNSKTFHYKNKLYVVGGTEFNYSSDLVNFTGEINNKILIFNDKGDLVDSLEIDSSFIDTIFLSVIEYTYKGHDGLLFTGGLKKDSEGKFHASKSVRFMAFEDLSFAQSPPDLKKARFGHSTIADDKGRVWVIGGLSSKDNEQTDNFIVESSIELFMPKPDNDVK